MQKQTKTALAIVGGALAIGIGGNILAQTIVELRERKELYQMARYAADLRKKPLLVVGSPRARGHPFALYPHGDVTIDLDPQDDQTQKVDVMEASKVFSQGQFGASFISHVLEHVTDPCQAITELYKVSDEVFVARPRPWGIIAYAHPEHRWIIHQAPPYGILTFSPNQLFQEVPP